MHLKRLSRVGKITKAGTVLKISIAAEYGRRDQDGNFQQNTYWNTITLFNDAAITWAEGNVKQGHLVRATGTIRETAYEKNGETVYGVTLAANTLDDYTRAVRNADAKKRN
ncbi:hypothetical protein FHS89_000535 [Rubricella aquisinus]|uniref:Single-stranded DNA-binding protein n=1 Tax=Rubricella aquisinus TaxID=2028108 RepID=A0A840X1J3_9RHOB|nr:single-stranded DNA-binding protein [Rubricella aquisinus]MBB5514537.1 hypothetical protein [Rubricella aquisinus]